METYSEHEETQKDPAQLNLIPHINVEKACENVAQALLPDIEATLEKDPAPEQLQADALNGCDKYCQQAK